MTIILQLQYRFQKSYALLKTSHLARVHIHQEHIRSHLPLDNNFHQNKSLQKLLQHSRYPHLK